MKSKKIWINALIFLGTLILCCLICEWLTYLIFGKKIALFPRYVTGAQYEDCWIRGNIPNSEYRHKSVDGTWNFTINGQGFRSTVEYSYTKGKDVIRILTLGDSYTIGFEVDQDQTYSAILENLLKSKGYNVEVINSGVSGFSNTEELVFFEQEGLKYDPDIVILGFYRNDLEGNVRTNLYRIEDGNLLVNKKSYLPAIKQRDFLNSFFIYRWLSEHSYLHNHLNQFATTIIKRRVLQKNTKVTTANSGSQTNENEVIGYQAQLACKVIQKIYSLAQENQIYFVLMDIPNFNLKASFPTEMCRTAEVCDSFLDTIPLLKQYLGPEKLHRLHGQRHWTDISHKIAGKHLAALLEPVIKNLLPPKNQSLKAVIP